ncbi:MAG: LCP family protein [Eubacteriales bacterium]
MATKKTTSTGAKKVVKKKSSKKKKNRIILFTVEIIILIILVIVLYGVMKTSQVEKISIDESEIIINENVVENEDMLGYWNIALFGVDARNDSLGKGNRSDTIIIASINLDTGDVKLLSVYRDTYLNLGNDTYNKANTAYAQGGPEQAINMLNMNLDMNITDYVTIGFRGLIDTIDALGGIYVDVDSAEIDHLNNYQITMAEDLQKAYTPVTTTGYQLLDGMQATAYCRIRYTAGDDFKRAERQREVIEAITEVAQGASVSTLNAVLDSVLPYVSTSLDVDEMADGLANITKYEIVASDGFPFEEYRTTGTVGAKGSCVIPVDLEVNVAELHSFFFGGEAYTMSSAVKDYSAQVSSDTGVYAE